MTCVRITSRKHCECERSLLCMQWSQASPQDIWESIHRREALGVETRIYERARIYLPTPISGGDVYGYRVQKMCGNA